MKEKREREARQKQLESVQAELLELKVRQDYETQQESYRQEELTKK